ncbi:MAG: sugar nucleotide-binding protein [Candidatus Magasanikbacteria bacterium]|mgnify:CR=1 FL=1|jgi:3,5-epimerase/4-reductase|nr:sugar nucleotide-binding protein [Candidatus Magasanikbacteria bacterium]MBT4314949.1 sugar nucleotide-binding protein [Candidatus Magasanikbacteria bacterium]MBT4546905.1 sugar nucleotide-binding protein [Candidatus Magasanikbacteria bacterium]MBT6819181.1 sugar nucleotide-binding protein [Candidatus Magasanikbacteria bacterium]
MKILIIGKGYIGERCHKAWQDSVLAEKRVETKQDVLELLDEHNPDAVLNAAGVRGKPNVDWCEDHQMETILGNTVLPIMIAQACQERNIYLLHIGSGCVFYGDSSHEDKKWRENDFANPKAVYSKAKYAADLALQTMPNIGIGRIRMPIDYIPSPSNMIDKLSSFPKVIDVENSVTIIDDMVEVFYQLMEKKSEGIFHVTNPGTLKHREIIDLYQELVDPDFTCEWITEDDLVDQGLAKKHRSNNFLASENLEKVGIKMREVHDAMRDTMSKYAEAKKAGESSDDVLVC